ncbi:hypothetical protein E2605_07530 [Dysgonomonas capnocytophagoides]|uniref:Lipocalin-like domain-containing protein n=1 Tax=Dysgonomonas capnocytophagoides TaxID=45254 RepID=A0A4Y8L316_9BACT|nr:hypothetical protein [Dysgonomonas capnocytophagoides]TFD96661.1 hypothetical protein E2605_07530 [Dysgonomonas capnocytophagoides]
MKNLLYILLSLTLFSCSSNNDNNDDNNLNNLLVGVWKFKSRDFVIKADNDDAGKLIEKILKDRKYTVSTIEFTSNGDYLTFFENGELAKEKYYFKGSDLYLSTSINNNYSYNKAVYTLEVDNYKRFIDQTQSLRDEIYGAFPKVKVDTVYVIYSFTR